MKHWNFIRDNANLATIFSEEPIIIGWLLIGYCRLSKGQITQRLACQTENSFTTGITCGKEGDNITNFFCEKLQESRS